MLGLDKVVIDPGGRVSFQSNRKWCMIGCLPLLEHPSPNEPLPAPVVVAFLFSSFFLFFHLVMPVLRIVSSFFSPSRCVVIQRGQREREGREGELL